MIHDLDVVHRRHTPIGMDFKAVCSCGAESGWTPTRPQAIAALASHNGEFRNVPPDVGEWIVRAGHSE
jgi:hypothetical protein